MMNNGKRTRFLKPGLLAMSAACVMVVGMGANSNIGGLEEIVLDLEFHHLGDNFFATWTVPSPEGTILELTFPLNQGQIQRAKTAHLELFLFNNHWANIIVNGRALTLPYTGETSSTLGLEIAGKTLLSIPPAFLQSGVNSIAFETTQHGSNFDDFEFGEVVLLLNR